MTKSSSSSSCYTNYYRPAILNFILFHVIVWKLGWKFFPSTFPLICLLRHVAHVVFAVVLWRKLPQWTKTKSRDKYGQTHFAVLGKLSCAGGVDPSIWQSIVYCAGLLSDIAKQEVHSLSSSTATTTTTTTKSNKDVFLMWPRMLVSYIVVVLHRNLIATRITDHGKDKILLAGATQGRGFDPVSREALTGLMDRIQYAKWAYPFDKDYTNLEECLKREGYILLGHDQTPAPGRVAHYTAINQSKKILLIVPRGSSALSDIVTDAAGSPVEHKLSQPYDDRIQGIWSHQGCMIAAKALANESYSLVDRLVTQEGYKLELVGHSLGGAVASVMGILLLNKIPALRDTTKFHVWAYAPPPCLNEQASQVLEPFVTTIVWNDDCIPTLSVDNYLTTCKIIADMHEQEAKFHGYLSVPRALLVALTTSLGIKSPKLSLSEKRLDYMCEYALKHAKTIHKERQVSSATDPSRIHVPGKVIYLWERSHNNQVTGEINGVSANGTNFLHLHVILPTKQSFADHFLDSYETGMQRLLTQMGDRKEHRKSIFEWEDIHNKPKETNHQSNVDKDV